MTATSPLVELVRQAARPLTGAAQDYDPLLDLVGDAHFVLLGEASHGTHEFYRHRAEITKRLITDKGFNAVAVEADWPDAYRVNCYVRGVSGDPDATDALGGFKRFPTWMWRNADVLDFIGWLRAHNDQHAVQSRKVGFYGLDLYSLFASIEAVIAYLDKVDPEVARRARQRYACFDHFDTESYGYATAFGQAEPCEQEVVSQLVELQRDAVEYARRDGRVAEDEFFYAEQNARIAVTAEEYYRSMFRGGPESRNLRDCHMADTVDALVAHLENQGGYSKVVVWAHNSHVGDARATEMTQIGELSIGQILRDRHVGETVNIGFSTYRGTVTAASNWGGEAERKQVLPALADSYEALFHETGVPDFLLTLRDSNRAITALRKPRLERAIGVIYLPQTERASHYFYARLPAQFDAILYFDHTRAVEPLERTPAWDTPEAPETYPFNI